MKRQTTLQENPSGLHSWMLLIGIILIGSNLRAPLTAVGSLIPSIRGDLGLSNAIAGTITTLPLLAFAFLSPFAPKIAYRFSMEKTIFYSMIVLAAGILIRSVPNTAALFSGTILIGLAIAIGNVLIPGFIKLKFPMRIGVLTGLYAVFMNLFGALAAGLSVPLSSVKWLGWHGALGFWAILTVVAIVFWLPQLRNRMDAPRANVSVKNTGRNSIYRSPLAWKVTIYMGSQSLVFYTLMTWLPEILQKNGYSSTAAGWTLFLMQFAIIPITFVIPILAGKMKDQLLLNALTAGFYFLGIGGLLQGNQSLIPLWVIMIGIASGSAFSLSMMFFTLRTKDAHEAAELSGMAQSFGYLLAAVGPVLFGGLHDLTGGWTLPLVMLLAISLLILLTGMGAGKQGYVQR